MKKQLPLLAEHLVSHWLYKIVALVVAVAIWFTTLENKKDIMRSRYVKINYLLSQQYSIQGREGEWIKVAVVGPKNTVYRFIQSTASITLDLADATAGKKMIEVQAADLGLPSGVRLMYVEPKSFVIEITEGPK